MKVLAYFSKLGERLKFALKAFNGMPAYAREIHRPEKAVFQPSVIPAMPALFWNSISLQISAFTLQESRAFSKLVIEKV